MGRASAQERLSVSSAGLIQSVSWQIHADADKAHANGQIERDPQGAHTDWCQQQKQLYRHDWVVYAKAPLGGPAQVLEYLSRYTHRTAIGNERIRAISEHEVAFTVRADDQGGKRLHRMEGKEFVRRFLLHVLPTGAKRIRHYGVLASSCKSKKLNAARLALQMPALNSQALESAQAFMARLVNGSCLEIWLTAFSLQQSAARKTGQPSGL